jgi:broad specificity phosphatase PhoE
MWQASIRITVAAILVHLGRSWLSSSTAFAAQLAAPRRGMASSTPSSMDAADDDDKQIVFVRHSITYMNEYLGRHRRFGAPGFTDRFSAKERQKKYQDTPLSPDGLQLVQKKLARRRPSFLDNQDDDDDDPKVDLVVVSPLRRALQTYDLGLHPHLEGLNVPVVALAEAAERLYLISDVGSPVQDLQTYFDYVDFGQLPQSGNPDQPEPWWWTPPEGAYTEWRPTGQRQSYACPSEPASAFDERMSRLYSWLEGRPERKIVVVCHHGVIDWMLDMDFVNCQWRQVAFAQIQPASLVRQS